MRQLVVGDIHGAYKCLMDVLEKAGPADRVIFLGDYVDGLPQTYEVIEHIMGMKNAVCIRGNHDQWAIDWMKMCRSERNYSLEPQPIHFSQGGESTYRSYMKLRGKEKVMLEHLYFLEKHTSPHFLDEEHRLFVHGGITTDGIETPDHIKMWDRSLIQTACRVVLRDSETELFPPFSNFEEVYVGHTATTLLTGKEKHENWLNLWEMDTNCGWGGPLCAMDVDTKEAFYSAPAREHYPGYGGR